MVTDFTRRLAADRRKLEKAGVPLGNSEYRFEHTNRKHIDALAGVLDRLDKGGMLEEFADMAGSSNSDGLVFDGRRYLKGKEAETLQAGGLLEAVPSKSGWDYRLTQEGRALTKVMARSRDAAADGKPAGKAQSARAKDTPVAGKAAVAKNAANEKPSENTGKAKPEAVVKTALDNPQEAQRKARVLQGEPVYTVKERTAPRENKALREWAVALFDKAGNKAVNPEIGEVALTERSVKDSMAHGMNPGKAMAFEAVPTVIGQGVLVASAEHGRMTSYFISAPVMIEGVENIVTVLVRKDMNKKAMYLHSVTAKEKVLNAAVNESAADTEVSEPHGKLQSGRVASVLKKLLEYKTQGGKTENAPSEGLRFSLDESPDSAFARVVDDVTGGKVPAGFISLGTTPDVWKLVGLPDGKVRISGGVIDKAMNGKHSVTAEALKDLPRHLNSPIAVFKSSASSSNPDGYVVLTELVEREKDKDKPIIAALNLGRAKNGLELLDISSVYGRNNGQLTRAFNQDLLYLHKAKGRHFLTTRPLQLHWDITSDADLVKRNIKTDSDLAQYSSAKKQVSVDKAQRMAQQHAESIKKRLAESIGRLAEQVDVAAVSETAPDKAQMLLSERVEGWFDGRTGKITLVAENLTPERAVWVAWHELGHRGFAAEGFAKYREELERADGNSLIRRIADAVQEEREGTGDAAASVRSAAVEEAIVELYAAQRTGDWSGIENRYGVKVGNGLKRGITGVLARIGAVLRRVLQRLTGKADGAMSDADVFAMLADLHGNAEGARDAVSDGVLFRIYSDDADKVARAADILTGSPVVDIESGLIKRDENGKVIANAREFIRKWLAENRPDGIFRHPEVGEVMLTVRGVKNSLSHFSADIHVDALPAVPYVLENSAVLEYSKDKNGDNVENVILAAPANIGGKRHYVVVRLRKDLKSGQKPQFYVVAAQLETDAQRETALAVETRSSRDGHIAGGKNRLLNILHSALISVNQIKSAAGNTGTVDAGIADFDTEAVRFSRAANIGAAISHITGKKSDLRNALKDRWDASKGIQLQFLGRRQIEDIYGGSLDGLKEYGRLSELFGADANKAVTEADKVVREWGRLKKEDAKALADLMHDATLAKVDADPLMRGDAQKRLDGIRTALDIADGKIEKAKAVIASANARIARADAAYNKASEAAKKAEAALLAAEEKAGREILADEADMRLRRLFYADSEAKRALRQLNKI